MIAVAIGPCRRCGKKKPENAVCAWCAADEEYATHAIAEVYR